MSEYLIITRSEQEQFFNLIGFTPRIADVSTLRELVARIQHRTCYSNIAMLTRNPRHSPTRDEIAADFLSGLGGGCTVNNVFVHSLLRNIGYECHLLPCYTDSQTIVKHIALRVNLDGMGYFVDFGNGWPYFEPCQLGDCDKVYYSCGFSYRLVCEASNKYSLQHKYSPDSEFGDAKGFVTNLWIEDNPVGLDYFEDMTCKHYTDRSFGHLLNCFRLIVYPRSKLYALRYDVEHGGSLVFYDGERLRCENDLSTEEIITRASTVLPFASNLLRRAIVSMGCAENTQKEVRA